MTRVRESKRLAIRSSLPTCEDGGEVRLIPESGNYAISTMGNVWSGWMSSGWRKVAKLKDGSGHMRVKIHCKSMSVSRLLLTTFVAECPVGTEACHSNGIPDDDRLCNLRWDTRSANRRDERRQHGPRPFKRKYEKTLIELATENAGRIANIEQLSSPLRFAEISELPGYRFGSDGSVWSSINNRWSGSVAWRQLKPWEAASGHLCVGLKTTYGKKLKSGVHRLILKAFVGPAPTGKECAHANGIPWDNRIGNLRWATHAENIREAVVHGVMPRGQSHPIARITEQTAKNIKVRLAAGELPCEVAEKENTTVGVVIGIRHNRTWSHLETTRATA